MTTNTTQAPVSRRRVLQGLATSTATALPVAVLSHAPAWGEVEDPIVPLWREHERLDREWLQAQDLADELHDTIPRKFRMPPRVVICRGRKADGTRTQDHYAYYRDVILQNMEQNLEFCRQHAVSVEHQEKARRFWEGRLAEFDRQVADRKAAEDASGFTAAQENADRLHDDQWETGRRICEMHAQSLAGLEAQCRLNAYYTALGEMKDGRDLKLVENIVAGAQALAATA